jgi:mono/diheme cytochrome c family protein
VLALTGYETALLVVALAFIAFALVAALVIPRSRPGFPGNRLGLFLAICGVFFVAQMTAVLVLAEVGEADEPAHEEAAPGEGEEEPPPGEEPPPAETAPPEAGGSTALGKEIFLGSAGCASCHTLADAGATGTIGPNLDATQPSLELAVDRVTNGQGGMPSFADTLSEEEIQEVAAYVSAAAGG